MFGEAERIALLRVQVCNDERGLLNSRGVQNVVRAPRETHLQSQMLGDGAYLRSKEHIIYGGNHKFIHQQFTFNLSLTSAVELCIGAPFRVKINPKGRNQQPNMSEQIITSRDNALVKHARAVRDGRVRESIFVEGLRLCEEALSASLAIQDVICTERIASDERGARLLSAFNAAGNPVSIVSEFVFASISDTKTPQGIVALARRPASDKGALLERTSEAPLLVILHRINNPANAGAIFRTAEAAGAGGVILTEGTSDIFSPKAMRGAMGSSFRLPLWANASFEAALAWCKEQGIKTICADLRAERTHTEIDLTRAAALIVGAESTGLTTEEMALADEAMRIPMRSPVESLNVAVAAAIVLYEAARQRAVVSGQWSVVS